MKFALIKQKYDSVRMTSTEKQSDVLHLKFLVPISESQSSTLVIVRFAALGKKFGVSTASEFVSNFSFVLDM